MRWHFFCGRHGVLPWQRVGVITSVSRWMLLLRLIMLLMRWLLETMMLVAHSV